MDAPLEAALVPILRPHPRPTWLTQDVIDAFAEHVRTNPDDASLVDGLVRRQQQCYNALGNRGDLHDARLARIAAADPARAAPDLLEAALLTQAPP